MRVIPVELRPGAPEGAALGRGWHNFAVTTNRSRPVRAAVGLSLFRLALSASAFGEFPKGHRNGPFCCPSPVLHVQFRSCRVRAAASTKTERAGHEIPALGPEGPRSLATARSAALRGRPRRPPRLVAVISPCIAGTGRSSWRRERERRGTCLYLGSDCSRTLRNKDITRSSRHVVLASSYIIMSLNWKVQYK